MHILKKASVSFSLSLCCVFLILVATSACGGSINPLVNVPDISLPLGITADRNARGAEVAIESVLDSRSGDIVAKYKGVQAKFSSDVSASLRKGIETLFRQKGIKLSEDAPVLVNAEIKQWGTQFASESPAKVEATAELYVEVIGPANRKIYSGSYKGFSSFEGSPFRTEQLDELLKTAMNEAFRQLTHDQGLFDLVTSF